jgi:hypothetical protein
LDARQPLRDFPPEIIDVAAVQTGVLEFGLGAEDDDAGNFGNTDAINCNLSLRYSRKSTDSGNTAGPWNQGLYLRDGQGIAMEYLNIASITGALFRKRMGCQARSSFSRSLSRNARSAREFECDVSVSHWFGRVPEC